MSADSLHCSLHGPEFPTQSTEACPQRPVDMNAIITDDNPGVKKDAVVYRSEASTSDPFLEITECFSSWTHSQENSCMDTLLPVKPLPSWQGMKDRSDKSNSVNWHNHAHHHSRTVY